MGKLVKQTPSTVDCVELPRCEQLPEIAELGVVIFAAADTAALHCEEVVAVSAE